MTAISLKADKPDHRIEVARHRREVMRSRILSATMKVGSSNPASTPTIDDIIQEAGISRGAFYRYFNSSAEAVEEVGVSLINELADAIRTIYGTLTDPLQRACVGTLLVMTRAAHDPEWASFILRGDLTIHKSRITDFIEHDMRKGAEAGYFSISSVEWAAEFVMGHDLTAIRGMMVRDNTEKDLYRREAVLFLLRALGADHDDVARVMKWSDEYLSSTRLSAKWWKSDEEEAPVPKARKRKPTT